MHFEDSYLEDRFVACDSCGFDDELEVSIVSYSTIEIAEWDCPTCGYTNNYENDTLFDAADRAYEQQKEERAWSR